MNAMADKISEPFRSKIPTRCKRMDQRTTVTTPDKTLDTSVDTTTANNGMDSNHATTMSQKRMNIHPSTTKPKKRVDTIPETTTPDKVLDTMPRATTPKKKKDTNVGTTTPKQNTSSKTIVPNKLVDPNPNTTTRNNRMEKNIDGLSIIGRLAEDYPDFLATRLQDVCLTLIQEVMNLRSCVSRVAMDTLGIMYTHLQKRMDPMLEATVTALLNKVGVANEFIRQDVDAALDCMVQNCTATAAIKALLAGGLRHLNNVVRKCTAQHLSTLVERTGADLVLSEVKGITESVLPAIASPARDSSQEVRHFGRKMLFFLASNSQFTTMMKRYIPEKDIPEVLKITNKTQEFTKAQTSSPKAVRKCALPAIGAVQTPAKTKTYSVAEREDYVEAMRAQMGSKDFQQRVKAINKIVADCKEKPSFFAACKFPVFDAIVARLNESNRKINQHTLEALQTIIPLLKDDMAQVLNILVPAIVDNHLNSKIQAIHEAADGALSSLVCHLDNALLLSIFCTKAQTLSGNAKGHLTEMVADMVKELYPRKPQMVEQKVLPLLWKLLASSTNKGPTTTLYLHE
ncbi:hypothetical protein JZ751_001505, partial [Albula glossodonta]